MASSQKVMRDLLLGLCWDSRTQALGCGHVQAVGKCRMVSEQVPAYCILSCMAEVGDGSLIPP